MQRPFSLRIYLLVVVFALSWPLQIAYIIWGDTPALSYGSSSLSMIMVTVGTLIASRYIFRDGFAGAGWHWGRPLHYWAAIGFAAPLWVVPTLAGLLLGSYSWPAGLALSQVVLAFLLRFTATLIPGFGEEFGWRGYMLPVSCREPWLQEGGMLAFRHLVGLASSRHRRDRMAARRSRR